MANLSRWPYAPAPKHEHYNIAEINETGMDGLRVYYSTEPVGGTITTYVDLGTAEQSFGRKGVRSALLWELVAENPTARVLVVAH